MAKTNKLRKPVAVAAAGLHSDQPSTKAAAVKTGATARQPAKQQHDAITTFADGAAVSHPLPPMAKTKKLSKPAADVAAGQHSAQLSAGAEAVKSSATDRQLADRQANANPNSVFLSRVWRLPPPLSLRTMPRMQLLPDRMITTDNKYSTVNAGKKTVSFTGLFSSNRKLTGDNKLSKFAVDDGPLTLRPNDLLDVRLKLGFCLVGYIVGKFPGLKAIRALSQSDPVSNSTRSHMPDCFEFKDDDISLTPIWATLPSLPLECWYPNALGKIGFRIGNPIAMDSLTMKMERVSYARILVEVDASKKIVDQVEFVMPNGITRRSLTNRLR
ncbi:UNVERIFIED_CONTAM: hypothetical protein Sindi_2036000 [Sesamum indicum]